MPDAERYKRDRARYIAASSAYRRAHPEQDKIWKHRHYENKGRWAYYLRTYGITREQYNKLLLGQDGKCAICRRPEPGGRGDYFHIDHDHATNRIRGLLCYRCNTILGLLHDDPALAAAVGRYLTSQQSNS